MAFPLIVHSVSKRFVAGIEPCHASVLALQHASLVVRSAEIVGVVGPPGSGKSTLVLCAAGLLRPDAGEIWWFERYRSIALCAQLVRFVIDGPDAPRVIELAVDHGAKLILLDNRGGDIGPDAPARFAQAFERVVSSGGAILMTARDRNRAHPMCSRVVELAAGRTAATEEPSPVRAPARVAESRPAALVDPPFGWV